MPAGQPDIRPTRRAAPEGALAHVGAGMAGPGAPLSDSLRGSLEPALGADLGGVRLHTGEAAAQSARALRARAWTSGADIVFARGAYRPETSAGRELIAHEVAHTVQQAGASAPAIQRDEDPSQPKSSPMYQLPGGLTLFPGAERLFQLQGAQIPLPGSLRLTNALGMGPGPSFVLDVAPESLVLSMLGNVDLSAGTTPGTAQGHEKDPDQQARVSLVRPVLKLDPSSGKITGFATLQVPSGYPLLLHGPTELDVKIESTQLGAFSGSLTMGPLHADMKLRLKYDMSRLDKAAAPVFAPTGGIEGFVSRVGSILTGLDPKIKLDGFQSGIASIVQSVSSGTLPPGQFAKQVLALIAGSIPKDADLAKASHALDELGTELSHPGFSLSGSLGLGPLPLSTFSAEAPTTRPRERPLLGASAPFPLTTSMGGWILAPAGSITSMAVPALGYSHSNYGEKSGWSLTTAALPSLSTTALADPNAGFAQKFPVYVFAELTGVTHLTDSIDAGVRLTAQFSTAEFASQKQADPNDPNARLQQIIGQINESRGPASNSPVLPNIGLTVFGNF